MSELSAKRLNIRLNPDHAKVIALSYNLSSREAEKIYHDFLNINKIIRHDQYKQLIRLFGQRHSDFLKKLLNHFKELSKIISIDQNFSEEDKLLLASYFTKEYSFKAAALFNPSIVPLNKENDSLDFILSLRATGEGHISSVEFLKGKYLVDGHLEIEPFPRFAEVPVVVPGGTESVVNLKFSEQANLSERVIFPTTSEEQNGIEDVRLVRFEDEGETIYYGTYTAYDGKNIRTKILKTTDFIHFSLHSLTGKAIQDKGMALFPQKVDGKYAMISRQDGKRLFIMFSDDLWKWEKAELLMEAKYPWELAKIGNCGSPIKTDDGWLLITHGVGPMRRYVMSACLLDLKNPQRVIGRLDQPLLSPNDEEREGYVPNVVYSCGSLIYRDKLILPYAMSDSASGFALFELRDVINAMK